MPRLSASTRRVFLFALHEAYRLKYAQVEPEHVLIGLTHIDSEAKQHLQAAGISYEKLCDVVGEKDPPESEDPPAYSQKVQDLLARAADMALANGKLVQPVTLLRALLADTTSATFGIVTRLADVSTLQQRLDVDDWHEA